MTEEQQKILTSFETRVRQLMLFCDSLKREKAELENALEIKEEALRKSEELIRDLNSRYDNLKVATMISFGKTDIKGAKQKLSGLVREIDKCIALINE
jgi:exonuclease VII small subunit